MTNNFLLILENQATLSGVVDGNRTLTAHLLGKDLLAQVIEHIILDGTLYRTSTKLWIVAYLSQILDGSWSPAEVEALWLKHLLNPVHLELYHAGYLLLGERLEGDDVVDTIQELWAEGALQHITACIGSHDDDGVLEVDHSALVVGQATIVQYLQEGVEDIRVSLLYLIEENHAIWFAAHSLGQLATLIVSYIPRRRSNQTGDTELFLIFTHINTGHHRLVIEEVFCESLGKLCLTYTRGTQEDE